MPLGDVKKLADDWIRPQMEERVQDFGREVQAMPKEFELKGWPPASRYVIDAVQERARAELACRGKLVCEGYRVRCKKVQELKGRGFF